MAVFLYAGILGFMQVALSYYVVTQRRKFQVGTGDGGHPDLEKAIRVHGNFAEYVPFALLLLFFAETGGVHPYAIHFLGAHLVLCRILHCAGITQSRGATKCRFFGMVITYSVMIIASVLVLMQFVL